MFSRLKKSYPDLSITLIALNTDHAPSNETLDGIEVYRIPAYPICSVNPFFSIRSLKDILEKIDITSFDAIITQCRYYFFTNYMGQVAVRYDIPLIHIEHNGGYMTHSNQIVELLARAYDRFISPSVLQRAQKIICISEGVRQFIVSALGVEKEKTHVITIGIDESEWKQVNRKPHSDFPILFYGGRLIESKGIFVLLSCIDNLCQDYPKMQLYIAGSGPEEKRVREWIQRHDKETVISICGKLTHEEMQKLFETVDVYVNPSFYSEGLQVSLLEAACSGLSIVSTDVTGANEVLVHGKNGLIIPQNNQAALEQALRTLIKNSKLREKLGNEARQSVAERFSWEKIIKKFYDFAIR
jgi:glycosyltransferase involved in cell wall biosynthesis